MTRSLHQVPYFELTHAPKHALPHHLSVRRARRPKCNDRCLEKQKINVAGQGWRYISSLLSADELQQERNSCPLLRSCFIGSCHVGVSKRFSLSTSLAVFCLYTHFILADQISCRSYVGSVYGMRSLCCLVLMHKF